jgi:hypothetical protein
MVPVAMVLSTVNLQGTRLKVVARSFFFVLLMPDHYLSDLASHAQITKNEKKIIHA